MLGGKNINAAALICDEHVEQLAKYKYEWIESDCMAKYAQYRWKDKEKGVLAYIGDKIQFQNNNGVWKNMIYECVYDPQIVKFSR